jgi:peptidoglycan LD-endopeptidase LytH
MRAFSRLKPGWYVLFALFAYALIATVAWRGSVVALRELRQDVVAGEAERVALRTVAADPGDAPRAAVLAADVGLWFPVPGARVPDDDDHLPGAPRTYRQGHSEGFVFWASSSGVPVAFGTPVIAAGGGVVTRVDEPYVELSEADWETLLADVQDGAQPSELDRLRGRQVWLRLDDGRELWYGHLSGVRRGLTVGQRVTRGRVIAFAGNSGTLDGVLDRTTNARLHFEIRHGDTFLGEGLDADGVRLLAASLFTGP